MTATPPQTLFGAMSNLASHMNPFSTTTLVIPTETRPRKRSSNAIMESNPEEKVPSPDPKPRKHSLDIGIDLSIFETIFANNEAVDHF